ncbi:MAG: hypothetical protein WC384_00225 [Prolixibacteraceae bacterium]|jgi:hypothetical protein
MALTQLITKRYFYFLAGILFMLPVIVIARTGFFYVCYLPLILAAILFSGSTVSGKENQVPGKLIRMNLVVSGMILCELLFGFVLVVKREISFNIQSFKNDWIILLVELILGIITFILFFGIANLIRYFVRNKK